MNSATILPIVKQKIGLRTAVRDTYIESIIKGVIKEFESRQGLTLDEQDHSHVMLVVDYSAYRYETPGQPDQLPHNLRYRLKELYFQQHSKG
ncbi:hypothetical protein [Jeotgalibacillus aurantiacus]|uniref:hypothetical protein n=1 Tax=Jeotgalibacillus aurantiacus TaxID=2763266 RepID=UPI001D09F89B|nr:hypothetical protein [Jeotgalibacillus aurantiacus]